MNDSNDGGMFGMFGMGLPERGSFLSSPSCSFLMASREGSPPNIIGLKFGRFGGSPGRVGGGGREPGARGDSKDFLNSSAPGMGSPMGLPGLGGIGLGE